MKNSEKKVKFRQELKGCILSGAATNSKGEICLWKPIGCTGNWFRNESNEVNIQVRAKSSRIYWVNISTFNGYIGKDTFVDGQKVVAKDENYVEVTLEHWERLAS